MADAIHCNKCGREITDEAADTPSALRKPCPGCGATSRRFSATMTGGIAISGAFTAEVITYPEVLLVTANRLFAEQEYSIAVVVAHMACEIAVERALTKGFSDKGIAPLQDAVDDLLPSYNLSNDRIRKLFTAITGKMPQDETYWTKFKESAARRNKAVHEGKKATEPEARETLTVTAAMIAFLK